MSPCKIRPRKVSVDPTPPPAGIAINSCEDRVRHMAALRRVGWKIKQHGEAIVGRGDREHSCSKTV